MALRPLSGFLSRIFLPRMCSCSGGPNSTTMSIKDKVEAKIQAEFEPTHLVGSHVQKR